MCGSVFEGTKPARTSSRNVACRRSTDGSRALRRDRGFRRRRLRGVAREPRSHDEQTQNQKDDGCDEQNAKGLSHSDVSPCPFGWLPLGRLFDGRPAGGIVGRHRDVVLRLVSMRAILVRIFGRFAFHGNGTGAEEDCSTLGVGPRGSESIPTYRFSRARFPSSACRSHRTFSIDRPCDTPSLHALRARESASPQFFRIGARFERRALLSKLTCAGRPRRSALSRPND